MRVLIVDDDNERAARIRSSLALSGSVVENDVHVAGCINEAKIALKASYFDVLILDVVLPGRPDGKPSPQIGLNFLGQLGRSTRLHKPERIIGITAHSDDVGRFEPAFRQQCQTLVEARVDRSEWIATVCDAVTYTASSKLTRAPVAADLHVLTVHGIRTFGGWQTRLEYLLKAHIPRVECHSYKYGVFSAFAFLIPFIRFIEVRRLGARLEKLTSSECPSSIAIFSHSFGTYLVAHALKRLAAHGIGLPVRIVVFAGSVLPRQFDWGFLNDYPAVKIVNDCGDGDLVLYVSEAVVWGTGMSGKVGFSGFQNDRFRNRFFLGGHSLYFDSDDFMKRYWLPVLSEGPISDVDFRNQGVWQHELCDKIAILMGNFKHFAYGLVTLAISGWILGIRVTF